MARPFLPAVAIAGALCLVPVATSAMAAVDTNTYDEFHQFLEIYQQIKANYVDPVDDKVLIKGAIDGMLAALDPHSAFESGADYDNLKIQTEGNYGGLGLTVSMIDGIVTVVSPQEDTPGDRAGIKANDRITHINGQFIYGAPLDEAIKQMRGVPGTKVTLTLARPGRELPIIVTLVREKIVLKPVKWETRGDVGYININSFSEQTGADTAQAVAAITRKLGHAPLGYVVDLRENGGGLLSQAISVSDAFLDQGEIVSQRGREKGDVQPYYAETKIRGDLAHGLPIVVLIDAGTASASEIVAGALQDHHRALIMGERSFGKGSVQSLIDMGGNNALRLTTARYYTPSGRSVQEGGIEPDLAVPQISDPDYKLRPVIREADMRRHLVNEAKATNAVLEDDGKDDPRFTATPAQLKAQGVEDYQLWYGLKTVARVGGPAGIAAATRAVAAK